MFATHKKIKYIALICTLLLSQLAEASNKLISQNRDQNVRTYETLFVIAEEQENHEQAYDYAQKLAKIYDSQYPDSALVWVNVAYRMAHSMEDQSKQAFTLSQRSQFEFQTQKYDQSISSASRVLLLMEAVPNDSLKALALYRLGEGYEFTNRPSQGMDKYKECYEFAEQTDNTKMLAKLDLKMGDINQIDELFSIALKYYRKARSRLNIDNPEHRHYYYQAQYDALNVALKIPGVTQAHKERNCDSVLLMLEEVKRLDLDRLIIRFTGLSKLCIVEHDYEGKAIELESYEELEKQFGNKIALYHQLLINGKVALKQSKYKLAMDYADKCEQIGRKATNIDVISNALLLKKDVFLARKNYEFAYHVMEQYHTEKNKLAEEKRLSSFAELEKELESANKANEILRLSQQKSKLNSRVRVYSVLATAFATLLALTMFFFVRSRQKNQIIEKQNLRLSNQKESLELTNSTRDKLFSIISHDLRNTSVVFQNIAKKVNYLIDKGHLDVLRQLAKEMDLTAYEFNKLLQNLLSWTLIQKGEMINLPIEMKVHLAAHEVLEKQMQSATGKGVHLATNINKDLTASLDPQVFRSILLNLLDNAIKFCIQDDKVILNINKDQDNLVIQVIDTGVGMTDERKNTLFSFEHMQAERGTSGEKGVGFGLILVHELVTACNGAINIESEVGQGSTFEVRLPQS